MVEEEDEEEELDVEEEGRLRLLLGMEEEEEVEEEEEEEVVSSPSTLLFRLVAMLVFVLQFALTFFNCDFYIDTTFSLFHQPFCILQL